MISLLIPTFGGNIENLLRTIRSCESVCDDVVAVSTHLYQDELEALKKEPSVNTIVELPWNFVFFNGFSELHNSGTPLCKNDWILRLDVAETLHEGHDKIIPTLEESERDCVFSCNHENDSTYRRRIWNQKSKAKWSGLIHESITDSAVTTVLFEMRDTQKLTTGDPTRDEVFRWFKSVVYHALHITLRNNHSLLGETDAGWLKFLNDHRAEMDEFRNQNTDLFAAVFAGDLDKFKELCAERFSNGVMAYGVDFSTTGS